MRRFSAQMWRFLTRPHKKVNFSRVDLHVRPLLVVESSSFIKRLGLRKWGVEKKKKKIPDSLRYSVSTDFQCMGQNATDGP